MLTSMSEVTASVVIFGGKTCVCETSGVSSILLLGDPPLDSVKDPGTSEVTLTGLRASVARVVMATVCVSVTDGNLEKTLVTLPMSRVNFGVDAAAML